MLTRRRRPPRSMAVAVAAAWALATGLSVFARERVATSANTSAAGEPIRTTWDQPRPLIVPGHAAGKAMSGAATFIDVQDAPEGDLPLNLAYTPDGREIAVVQRDSNTVTFFDVDTRASVGTVAVGEFPVDVAVSPDGRVAVVPNAVDNTVAIIDAATHTLLDTVPITGEEPYKVLITPDSTRAIVGVINGAANSSFSIIDLVDPAEVQSFPSAPQGVIGWFFSPELAVVGNIFTQFALTPDGNTIILPVRGEDRVVFYDVATGDELASLATADYPTAVDISADGTTAIVNHEGSAQTVTKFDVSDRTVSGTFATGVNLTGQVIRITPDNNFAIAAISNRVVFVNIVNGGVTATINTGSVGDIEISFDGRYAFVSNFNSRVIDIPSQTLVRTIPFAAAAEAATSPTELRAVALNNLFREDVQFYNIAGAGGFFEGFTQAGEPPEGDVPNTAAITPDGRKAVIGNFASGNITIVDMVTDIIDAWVHVGDGIKELRITPDGRYAVVCAREENVVGIVDLDTATLVKSLQILTRPARVRISPDSRYAYVLNYDGTDRISFIRLDGANSVIERQLPAGQTGWTTGPPFTEISGIELSPDGSMLAVCDSFNDVLRLYDTASHSQVAQVPTGDFPLRVQFSPDGSRAYVADNNFSGTLTVVEVDGNSSRRIGTVTGVASWPLVVEVDADGRYVYVGTRTSNVGTNAIRVVDANTLSVVATVPMGNGYPRDSFMDHVEDKLYLITTDATVKILDAAGPGTTIEESTATSSGARELAFDVARKLAVIPFPVLDGADKLRLGPLVGDLDVDGDVDLADYELFLESFSGPGKPYPGGCDLADFNGDGHIDLYDFAKFQPGFTGS